MEDLDFKSYDDTAKIETDAVRIHDEQSGPEVVIRKFDYAYHPTILKRPTKAELLTPGYVKYLENVLWADALEMLPPSKKFPNPRVAIQKKGFTIFVACVPKKGNIIPQAAREQMEKPLHQRLIEKDNG